MSVVLRVGSKKRFLCSLSNTVLIKVTETQTVLEVLTIKKIINVNLILHHETVGVLGTTYSVGNSQFKAFYNTGPQAYVNTLNLGNGSVCFTYMIN